MNNLVVKNIHEFVTTHLTSKHYRTYNAKYILAHTSLGSTLSNKRIQDKIGISLGFQSHYFKKVASNVNQPYTLLNLAKELTTLQ